MLVKARAVVLAGRPAIRQYLLPAAGVIVDEGAAHRQVGGKEPLLCPEAGGRAPEHIDVEWLVEELDHIAALRRQKRHAQPAVFEDERLEAAQRELIDEARTLVAQPVSQHRRSTSANWL